VPALDGAIESKWLIGAWQVERLCGASMIT
jgi:hypothetical protein